jgi:hypothetical protein
MSNVIALDDYRQRRRKVSEPRGPKELWVCGRCANSTWVVTSTLQLRCSACNTRAANLEIGEPDSLHPATH